MTQRTLSWKETEEVVTELNLVIKGWGNYFPRFSALNKRLKKRYPTGRSARSPDCGAQNSSGSYGVTFTSTKK